MMTSKILRALFAVGAFLFLSAESCDPINDDSGFDIWCGDELCSWEVEEGDVAQVPTWHEQDYGVELLGNPATISQLIERTSADLSCVRFELIADVEETARVTLALDADDDGDVELEQVIPTSDWAPLSYIVTLPKTFDGLRLRITKRDTGRAVLAQIAVFESTDCDPTIPPLGE